MNDLSQELSKKVDGISSELNFLSLMSGLILSQVAKSAWLEYVGWVTALFGAMMIILAAVVWLLERSK